MSNSSACAAINASPIPLLIGVLFPSGILNKNPQGDANPAGLFFHPIILLLAPLSPVLIGPWLVPQVCWTRSPSRRRVWPASAGLPWSPCWLSTLLRLRAGTTPPGSALSPSPPESSSGRRTSSGQSAGYLLALGCLVSQRESYPDLNMCLWLCDPFLH
jgi:hypothetical protein